jgi:hypothetical protein
MINAKTMIPSDPPAETRPKILLEIEPADAAHWSIVMLTLQNVADTLNRYGEVSLIVIGDTILKVVEDEDN